MLIEDPGTEQYSTFISEAVRAYPDVTVAEPDFAAWLQARAVSTTPIERAGDLLLAYGCSIGDPHAVMTFEKTMAPVIERAISRILKGQPGAEDVQQQVFERLLLTQENRQAKIGQYAGRGKLAAWVGVVATRETLQSLRRQGREVPVDGRRMEYLGTPQGDLELAHMKTRYRQAFAVAFQAALDTLTERERLVLRYHVVDQLSIDQIAGLHAVHRATAARWISQARQRLLARTRVRLMRAEDLTPSEFESVTRLIRSQLDLSLSRRFSDES